MTYHDYVAQQLHDERAARFGDEAAARRLARQGAGNGRQRGTRRSWGWLRRARERTRQRARTRTA